jgi:hypothetical protein
LLVVRPDKRGKRIFDADIFLTFDRRRAQNLKRGFEDATRSLEKSAPSQNLLAAALPVRFRYEFPQPQPVLFQAMNAETPAAPAAGYFSLVARPGRAGIGRRERVTVFHEPQ